MQKNDQKEMESILKTLDGRPKLLLHSCCGPCSTYVLSYLHDFFDVTVFFYNPNICDAREYQKRLDAQQLFLKKAFTNVGLIVPMHDPAVFEKQTAGMEGLKEGGARCNICFTMRLSKTAKEAKALGADYFCSTLTVSPHKDAKTINAIGKAIGLEQGVTWLPSDFKKKGGYQASIVLSKQYGLYRQDYCGCAPSRIARNHREIEG